MSIYKSSSLAMIPTAYKDGKLYSIRPTDGSGDFTFSRGSNLAATRVDVNGLIEKGRENQILYSQDFSNAAWSKGSHTIVSNAAVAPDGTTTADKLVADNGLDPSVANSSGVFQNRTIPTSLYNISVYAKAAEFTSIRFRENYVVGSLLTIDLTDGSITGGGSQYSDAKAVSVGNGWYRISFFYNQTTGNPAKYTLRCADTGDGTSGVYIWGYQQEQGLVATDYIETGTSAAQSGILEDMPRLDYSGGASCPSLLLEPQRLNLVSQSEYMQYSNNTNVSVNDNETTSPEGVVNAAKAIPNATNSNHIVRSNNLAGLTSQGTYSVSVFAKQNGYKYIVVGAGFGSTATPLPTFDLNTGTIVSNSSNGTIEDYGNGWYKCTAIIQIASTALYPIITILNNSQSGSYVGDGTSAVYLYGHQIEEGSYPTSYIPTYGTSQTRLADDCVSSNIDGLIGDNQGTLFVQGFGKYRTGADNHLITLSSLAGGSGTDRVLIYTNNTTGNLQVYINSGGLPQYGAPINLGVQGTDANDKIAVAFADNDLSVYVNGSKVGSSTSGTAPTMFYLAFNEWVENHQNTSQYKQAAIFPTRLTDAELAALTTL